MKNELLEGDDWKGLTPFEVFDLDNDPGESTGLRESSDNEVARMTEQLRKLLDSLERVKEALDERPPIDLPEGIRPDVHEDLKQHGYVH